MKKFLIVILTIFITLVFIILGISLCLRATVIENIEGIVKEEITNEIAYEVAKNISTPKEEIKEELIKVMEKDAVLKKVIENGLDKALDILSGREVNDLDITKELEIIVNNSEEVLKEYGITITEEEKKDLLKVVDSEKINQEFQFIIKEVQETVPRDVQFILNTFEIFRSSIFKVLLISSILVCLLCIAFLKKSYYKWLGNLGVATLTSGVFYGFFLSSLINLLNQELINRSYFTLKLTALNRYGYVLAGIGFLAFILKIVVAKIINSKEKM